MDKNILIIYHTKTGNTKLLVDYCVEGLRIESEINIKIKNAADTIIEDIVWADGLVLATPENFGSMAGIVKDFFERTYYPARDLHINKPYILLISCETDGSGTERQIQTIATGYVLKQVQPTIIVKEKDIHQSKETIIELGTAFSTGLCLGIF